jgi:ABC-2 type transport system ATP-binding protein
MSSDSPILSIVNVSKIYPTKDTPLKALDNVCLDIKEGEIFGLLGVNGAGKTTLSSILATLHPATSGDILFRGTSIYKDINRYRQALGYCPQYQNLDPELTVEENLIYAGRYFLMPEDVIRDRVASLMEHLELTRYANFEVDNLSGGNRQRVLIARALMHNPSIVILDEPTVGLDPDIRRKLWALIQGLKARGITVILTTHYLDEAEELSDRICILHRGKVRLIESVKALKEKHGMASLEDIFIRLTGSYTQES